MGVEPSQPPQFVVFDVSPTINNINFNIGTLWLNYRTQNVYMLVNVEKGIATWILFSGNLHFLTSNSGGPIGPDSNNNINVVGDGTTITGVGNPGTHTITFSTVGTGVVNTLTGNSGGAVSPTAGNINVVGSGPITVTGNPGTSTLTISTSGSGTVESLTTDDGHVVTPTAGTIILHGGNNITTTGTVGPNTATVSVSGTTNHAIQIGNSSGSLTSLSVGTNGQLPIGSTGANPVMSTLTAGTNITITNGAGSITIASTSIPASTCSFFAYNNADAASFFSDGVFKTLQINATLFDLGSNFNTGTFTFTAPNTGYYCFQAGMAIFGLTDNTLVEYSLQILTSGSGAYLLSNGNPFNQSDANIHTMGVNQTIYVHMTAGDTAKVQGLVHNNTATGTASLYGTGGAIGSQYRTMFSGFQVA